MKNLKKYLLGLALITTFTLTSCNNDAGKDSQSQETTSKEATSQAEVETPQTTNVEITIYDKVNDEEILTEEVALDSEGLQTYLEKNHKAKFENGMMTELHGISQDESKNQYWMYYVNGEMAEVGIGDYEAKEGDKIELRFEQM